MTVDMLAATFFWPEGAFLQVRDNIALDDEGEKLPSPDQAADPLVEDNGETFWTMMLRQMGWPLPRLS